MRQCSKTLLRSVLGRYKGSAPARSRTGHIKERRFVRQSKHQADGHKLSVFAFVSQPQSGRAGHFVKFCLSDTDAAEPFHSLRYVSTCQAICPEFRRVNENPSSSGCRSGKCQQLHDARTRTDSSRTHPMYGCAGVVVSACCDQVR